MSMEPMTVGELRRQIASLPDSTPVFICDDYNYGKFYRSAYQCVQIAGDDSSELYIEFHTEPKDA